MPTGAAGITLGRLLRAWRERALLTQEELAGRAGLNVRTIRRLEHDSLLRPRSTSVRLLAEALGLDPAEQAILADAARPDELAPPPTRAGAPDAAGVVPRQLPADAAAFTGRTAQLRQLDTLLPAGAEYQPPPVVVISAISGTAGVGKTALAVHWAHRMVSRFSDGQLYVNLRGFDPAGSPLSPAEALRGFLDALAVPPHRIPASLDTQAGLYRSLLAGKRVLVVLDNARDADQVRPLLPGSPGCLALVTSRAQLTSLVTAEGAHPLTLDLLTHDEAHQLLTRRLGPDRIAAEPDPVEQIITLCAGLPLALSIVAARAVTRPEFTLAALASGLCATRGDLDAFAGGDTKTDVRAVFSWSYQTLSPAAARLFRLLGLHPGPDIATPAAASLAGLPARQARPLLAELTQAHLVTEHTPGRYAFHDLLRAYATELVHAGDPETDQRTAVHRMLDHYLHTAHAAALLLRPSRDPITPAPAQPGSAPERIADERHATAWFVAENAVLLAAIDRAESDRFDTHAWQLAWSLETHFQRRGPWHEWIGSCAPRWPPPAA